MCGYIKFCIELIKLPILYIVYIILVATDFLLPKIIGKHSFAYIEQKAFNLYKRLCIWNATRKINNHPLLKEIRKMNTKYTYKYKGKVETDDTNSIYYRNSPTCNDDYLEFEFPERARLLIKRPGKVKNIKFLGKRHVGIIVYKFTYYGYNYTITCKTKSKEKQLPKMRLNVTYPTSLNCKGLDDTILRITSKDADIMLRWIDEMDNNKIINCIAMMNITNYIIASGYYDTSSEKK